MEAAGISGTGVGKMKVLISIVVPVYNAQDTIQRCIESVRKQTYKNWELILVEDGSVDDSLAICRTYAEKDERIILFSQGNQGVSAARNHGIKNASGDYILFLDSDDAIAIDMLEKYADIICRFRPDAVIGSIRIIKESGERELKGPKKTGIFGQEIWNCIAENSEPFGWAGGKAFRREMIKINQLEFRHNMKSQEDLEFNLRVYAKSSVLYVTEYAGYDYYYVPSARTPNILDFINNQLMIAFLANMNTTLNNEAEEQLKERIMLLVYTYLYNASDYDMICKRVDELLHCEGLSDFIINNQMRGEHGCIAKWVVQNKRRIICFYFQIRKLIRNIVYKIRK